MSQYTTGESTVCQEEVRSGRSRETDKTAYGEVIAAEEWVAYLGLKSKLFASPWRESFQLRRWL